jgi:hypothetical protein
MRVLVEIQPLPADHVGEDPSGETDIVVKLARCRSCHKVLDDPRYFCNSACKDNWHNRIKKANS